MLAAYAAALRKGDAQGAYARVAPRDRAALDPADYAARLARDAREARELGESIARAPAPRVFARVTLDDGTELALEQGPDGFVVSDVLAGYYGVLSARVRDEEHCRRQALGAAQRSMVLAAA
ncbi:MAG: hypothetical protein RLZZ450_6898 [Pseudomonadota bacterium]